VLRRHTTSLRLRRESLNLAVGLVLLAVLAFMPSLGRSTVAWRGDFETGTLTQWDNGVQAKDASRVAVVSAPLRQGKYAARFEVRPGDNNVAGSGTGERAEVLAKASTTDGVEGHESYWAWSTYFPSTFDAPMGGWNAFTQFHHTGPTGQANMMFAVADMKSLTLRVMGGDPNAPARKDFVLAPLQKGAWYDLVLHVKWSASASTGFVEAWINGNRVVPKTFTPTLYSGMSAYAKQGYYRSAYSNTTVVYQDGMRRGSSYEEVAADFPSTTPSFSVSSSIGSGSTLSGTVQWTASPSGATASSVTFSIDGSPVATDTTAPFVLPLDTTKLANAAYTFEVDATATDGRKASASSTATVKNQVLVSLSVTDNLADGQTVSNSITWVARPAGQIATKVEFRVNGGLVATKTVAPWEVIYDTTQLANGTYPFTVKAYAADGSTASDTSSVQVANAAAAPPPPPPPPAFSITQNVSDGLQIAGTFKWIATPAGRAVNKVSFYIDGRKVATKPKTPYDATVDTTRRPDGTHAFLVEAVASDGSKASASANVVIANQSTGTSSSPTSSGTTSSSTSTSSTTSTTSTTTSSSSSTTTTSSSPPSSGSSNPSPGNGNGSGKPDGQLRSSIRDGEKITGLVTWTVDARGFDVSRIEFFVDSKLMWTERLAPYVFGGDDRQLDTATLSKGTHVLEVRAFASDGSVRTLTLHVTVKSVSHTPGTRRPGGRHFPLPSQAPTIARCRCSGRSGG
jgi:hypothetical protein